MPTIAELKAAHDASGEKPEELRIRCLGWGDTAWYCPMFLAENKWYGLYSDGQLSVWSDIENDRWHLWQEPRLRKVVYQWVVRHPTAADSSVWITSAFYTEKSVREYWPNSNFYHKLLPGRDAETGEVVDE